MRDPPAGDGGLSGEGWRYWLGLGSNLGDRAGALRAALDGLDAGGHRVEAVSAVWETSPRDVPDQPAFLNAAARVRSPLEPPGLLRAVKRLERALGRDPGGRRRGPRAIDCDLLLWEGGEWREDDLVVPHPRLAERRFALLPLLDLDPGLALPGGEALAALLERLDPREQPARRLPWALRPPGAPAGGRGA